jgi:prepilin-type N-terminal cleavage/methylation domain-containing protein
LPNSVAQRKLQPVLSHRTAPRRAFTLVELLVVIGVISILLVATLPVVNSLSKSGGRKGAVGSLLGAVEQARARAISDGRPTYLVLATALPTADPALTDRYAYRAYAICQDDPANPPNHGDPADPADGSKPKIQLTSWKPFSTGVSLRTNITAAPWIQSTFPFPPAGANVVGNFPYLMFNESGEVVAPPSPILISVFEGTVNGTSEVKTSGTMISETIAVSPLTGRAQATATP